MREGWEYKKLGEVGTFTRCNGILKSDFVEKGCPCIHYGQIHTKFGVSTDRHLSEISEDLFKKSKIANPGDIVLAITSEDVEGSCKCTAWMGNYDIAVGAHAAILKHQENPKYLAYCFRSKNFGIQKAKYARGFKVTEIKPSEVALIEIPVPPLPEQQRIVSELDLLSSIIDKQKAQLKELDNLAQSIFYDMFGDPVVNEKGWEVKKMGEVSDIIAGGDKPSDLSDTKKELYLYPVIANGEGDRGILGYSKNYRISQKSVTIGSRGASIGNCRIVEPFFTPAVRLITLTPKQNLDCHYLFFYSKKAEFNINGAGQAQLTVPNVKSIDIPLPPLSLQQLFAEKIQAIESQKASITQSIAETQKLFDYTMDKYFG